MNVHLPLSLFVVKRQMSLQVHRVMENTNDLDPHLSFDMEEDKVTSTIPLPSGMQRMQALGDVGTRFCPCDGRAFAQTCDGASQDAFIEAGLFFAEPVGSP